jgi:hypothetical protein
MVRPSTLILGTLSALAFLVAQAPAQSDWTQLAPSPALPTRSAMASCYDPASGKVVLFGGYDDNTYKNETWIFDGASWSNVTSPVGPSARAAASMAWDAVSQRVVLFGGYDGKYLGDTWLWNGLTGTWSKATPATSPKAVTGPMLFTDPLTGHAIDYGGFDGQFYQSQTWRWTGTTWQALSPAHAPWARSSAAVAPDEAHGTVLLFAGLASVNPWNTWLWDGTDWHEQALAVQPLNRYDGRAAWDPQLGKVVLFGGASGGEPLNDTWTWTGSAWEELTPPDAPPPREAHAMAYLPSLARIVVAGGEDHGIVESDTWSFVDGGFTSVGRGLGGALGVPVLAGSGDLTPGSATGFVVVLTGTAPFNPVTLFVGLDTGALPLKGGTFYPVPVVLQLPLAADFLGSVALTGAMPAGMPGGTSFVAQAWMPDATAPKGFAASNGLQVVVP